MKIIAFLAAIMTLASVANAEPPTFLIYQRAGKLRLISADLSSNITVKVSTEPEDSSGPYLSVVEGRDDFKITFVLEAWEAPVWPEMTLYQRPDGSVLITRKNGLRDEWSEADLYADLAACCKSRWWRMIAAGLGISDAVPSARQVRETICGHGQRKATATAVAQVAKLRDPDWRVRRAAAAELAIGHHAELRDIRSMPLSIEQRQAIERIGVEPVIDGTDGLIELAWWDTERDL